MRWRCHCWDKEEITLESKTTPYPTTACKEEPHGIPTTSQPTLQFTNFFQKFTGTDLCFGEMHSHAHTGERRKKCTFLFFFFQQKIHFGEEKKRIKKKNQLTEAAAVLQKNGNVGLLVKTIYTFLLEYFSLDVAIGSRMGYRCAF